MMVNPAPHTKFLTVPESAQLVHEVGRVEPFIASQRNSMGSLGVGFDHRERGDALGVPVRLGQPRVYNEPRAVLHQRMTKEAQLALHPSSTSVEPRIRIRGRGMRRGSCPLTW